MNREEALAWELVGALTDRCRDLRRQRNRARETACAAEEMVHRLTLERDDALAAAALADCNAARAELEAVKAQLLTEAAELGYLEALYREADR